MEENVVMWVDDDIFPHELNKNYRTYCYIQKEAFHKNLHIILKSSTDTAMAYIKSPLFKASL
jgi:hypothetical protein